MVFGEPRSDEAYPGDRVVLLANFWHPNFGASEKLSDGNAMVLEPPQRCMHGKFLLTCCVSLNYVF